MKAITVLSALLVFCAVLYSVSGDGTDHPGSCPPDNARCAGPITSNCTDDSVCAANEKCCLNQCTNKCVSANLVKPGSCPLAKCASQYSKNTCSNDYDCVGNEKCCPSCGNNCYPPGPE